MAAKKKTPVAVIMGSDSDMLVMQGCIETLRDFGIEPAIRILSAHRTPGSAGRFARAAAGKGIKVIIAAAGMAAHLAGAMAAQSALPVIGVPLISSSGLDGIDALLSTVQMPPGVPVATMAIGKAGANNAAILAVQILALNNKVLAKKLADFKKQQKKRPLKKIRQFVNRHKDLKSLIFRHGILEQNRPRAADFSSLFPKTLNVVLFLQKFYNVGLCRQSVD